MFSQNRADLAPWRETGTRALSQINAGLDPGGQFARRFTMADFQQDPGYQFRMDEGVRALDRSAAQVEAYCRRLRNGDAEVSAAETKRLHVGRSLSRSFREDGTGTLTVELPRAELELVLRALEQVARGLPGFLSGS